MSEKKHRYQHPMRLYIPGHQAPGRENVPGMEAKVVDITTAPGVLIITTDNPEVGYELTALTWTVETCASVCFTKQKKRHSP